MCIDLFWLNSYIIPDMVRQVTIVLPGLNMNQKIRPVSLDRIIQTARFAEMTRACSGDELAEFLRISGKRAEEIAGEAVKIGLLEKDGSRYCETQACSAFLQCVREYR